MNAEDLYSGHPHLMTREEKEQYEHVDSENGIPTYSPILRDWILFGRITGNEDDDEDYLGMRPSPEAEYRQEFERRSPALGATPALLEELKTHYAKLPDGGVQQRKLYNCLRGQMLRQLISCDGAKCMDDLVDILQKEMDSGVPSPVPDWYKFSTVTFGPRKIGYDRCSNWLGPCHRAETHDKPQFARCSKCKVAVYCSRECQAHDWKARHKKVCKHVAKEREKITRASAALSMFAGR